MFVLFVVVRSLLQLLNCMLTNKRVTGKMRLILVFVCKLLRFEQVQVSLPTTDSKWDHNFSRKGKIIKLKYSNIKVI